MHWRWPQIRTLELISQLTPEQLEYAKSAGLVQGKIRIESGEIEWHYETPYGDIDPGWLVNHINKRAFSHYPEFPSLRELSEGSVEYNNETAFNLWMCDRNVNLAEKRIGQRFIWKASKAAVITRLGLADDAEAKLPARSPERLQWPTKMDGDEDNER